MIVSRVEITVVKVPQVAPVAPYRSHLRTSSSTQSAIVRVDTDAGLTGWGEFNVNFLPDASGRRFQEEARWLIARDAENVAAFHRDCPLGTRLKSGLEIALWDIRGKAAGKPVAALLGCMIR
jgi:galactonate dehydratase